MWGKPLTGKKTSRNKEKWNPKKKKMQWAEESLKIIIEISEISLTIKQDYSLSFLSDDSVTGTRLVQPLEATKNLKKNRWNWPSDIRHRATLRKGKKRNWAFTVAQSTDWREFAGLSTGRKNSGWAWWPLWVEETGLQVWQGQSS